MDADFLAHAREDIPALLADREELECQLAAERKRREKAEAARPEMRHTLCAMFGRPWKRCRHVLAVTPVCSATCRGARLSIFTMRYAPTA